MISKQLQLLIKLQESDLKIQKMEFLIKRIPTELGELRENCSHMELGLEEIKEEIERLEKERRAQERDIEAKKEEISKRKKRLMEVKTNKEYSAVSTEVDSFSKIVSGIEEEVITIMEKIEEHKSALTQKNELMKKEIENLARVEQEKKAEMSKLQQRLLQFKTRREEISKGVEENLLKHYSRISQGRKGLAVVPIVDNICQGCHMTVIPQTVAEVKRNNKIITCLHCSRILYWQNMNVTKAPLPQ